MELKKYQIVLGIVIGSITLSGIAYKSVVAVNSKVTQIATNEKDIDKLDNRISLEELRRLHRKTLSDYYYWSEECKRTRTSQACQNADEAKKRVDKLERQIEELEKR